jgi:hypothetical protein
MTRSRRQMRLHAPPARRRHLQLAFEADSPTSLEAYFGDPPFVRGGVEHSNAKITLRRKQEIADHFPIGPDNGVHLEIGTFSVGFELGDPMRFRMAIGDGALVLPKSSFGFMGALMPEAGVKFTFDVDLGIDTRGNASFAGGAGMTVTLPVNKSVLVLRVRAITLAFALEAANDGGAVSLSATVAFGLDFGGAFKVNVDNIGAKLNWALPSKPQPGRQRRADPARQSRPARRRRHRLRAAERHRGLDRHWARQRRRFLLLRSHPQDLRGGDRGHARSVPQGNPNQGRRVAA